MSRYRFELATEADDADLRHILAQTPMPGAISLRFDREPSYFAASVVEGSSGQIVAARDSATGHLVGFGARWLDRRFVNGVPEAIGYLSNLRLLGTHRSRGLVARGYAVFRDLHADGRSRLYLTTIAADNAAAVKLLTSGRAGLPRYHFAGLYHTVALPLGKLRKAALPSGLSIRPARDEDLPAALSFWRRVGPRRQFFPCRDIDDFCSPRGSFRGLRPQDLLLAVRGGEIVGTLGGWDQSEFRQTVVHAYGGAIQWLRPLYNGWARLRGQPPLPPPGGVVRYLTGALPIVEGDDSATFVALVAELGDRSQGRGCDYLLIGMHETDPLLPVMRAYRARWYTTRVYLVCWDDGEALRLSLDGRPAYLELGSL